MLFSFSTRTRVALSVAAISLMASGLANALSLSGTPTGATVGQQFEFAPTVSGTGGLKIAYGLKTNVTWLVIDRRTGNVSGIPNNTSTAYYVINVSDGTKSFDLKGSIAVKAAPNKAPVISGAPSINSIAGQLYSFTPKASDADGDKLTFSIQNKPSWALFNAATGALTGTPAGAGTFKSITISVSDGKVSANLAAFNLTINPVVKKNVTVSWAAPTLSTDGKALTNLAGYRVFYGTAPDKMTTKLELPGAKTTTVSVEELSSGTYYFAVKAYTTTGVESALSQVAYKQVF